MDGKRERARVLAPAACGMALVALGLTGCGPSFEGSGSKDAASAEQLALRTDDPWALEAVDAAAEPVYRGLEDGVYTGKGLGMDGLEITQEGETQSVGGYEAIRDGVYASMIDAAQCSDIDAISGATITTAGVKQAVDDARIQAGAEIEPRVLASGAPSAGE